MSKEASSSAEGRANPRKRLFSPEEEINVKKMETSTPNKKASIGAEGEAFDSDSDDEEFKKKLEEDIRLLEDEVFKQLDEAGGIVPRRRSAEERVRQLEEDIYENWSGSGSDDEPSAMEPSAMDEVFKQLDEAAGGIVARRRSAFFQPEKRKRYWEELDEFWREWETEDKRHKEVFVDVPYYQDLFNKTLLEGHETDNTIRVNVVGNFSQGKTSLTKSLVGKSNPNVQSTNGVEISRIKYSEYDGDVVFDASVPADESKLLDRVAIAAKKANKASSEKARSSEKRKDSSLLLPLSETKSETADYQEEHKNGNSDSQKSSKISHKKITQTQSLSTEEINQFFKSLETKTSTVDLGGNLEFWDFAGQFVFYATHTLFHSKRAVYLLVIDLSKPLSAVVIDSENPMKNEDKTMEQYIKFWLNSIHSFVGSDEGNEPTVILVGTHKDLLDGNENDKKRFAEDYFENIRTMFENTAIFNHIHKKDFAINCVDPKDKEVVELRKEIIRIGKEHANSDVPVRWIPLKRKLVEIKHKKIIPFHEVMEIASHGECPIKDEEQVKIFLLYNHTKGSFFFFDEKPLSGHVVLDPQFLIDAFKCIVTAARFCKNDSEYRMIWKHLQEEAKLEMDLIDFVWRPDGDNNFLNHKEQILMFMQKHLIISEVSSYDESTGLSNGLGWFMVPSFLCEHSNNKDVKEFLKDKEQSSLRFVMSFYNSPVVQIIYQRLIAALISKWSVVSIGMSNQKKFLLYKNLGVFRIDKLNAGLVELYNHNIDLRIVSLCHSRSIDSSAADKLRRYAESVVINEFTKMRRSSIPQEKPFKNYFRCNNESHGHHGSLVMLPVESLTGQNIEPCPDLIGPHNIYPKQALSQWFEEISDIEITNDCQFDEKQLSEISTAIGKEWMKLGIQIGLTNVQLERLEMDNNTSAMRIYKMLLLWVAEKNENATVNTLIQAMKSRKEVTIDWDIVRNIVEEIASKQ